jgi:hypothetical protein
MTDDSIPLTLAEAAAAYGLKVATLRAEAARGRLFIFPIGRRHYTTHADMREMLRLCRDEGRRRGYISTLDAGNGLSETARVSSAQAALKRTAEALRNGSLTTSASDTGSGTSPGATTR